MIKHLLGPGHWARMPARLCAGSSLLQPVRSLRVVTLCAVTKPAVWLRNIAAGLSVGQQCGLNTQVRIDPHVHVCPLPFTCSVTVRKLPGQTHSKSELCQLA